MYLIQAIAFKEKQPCEQNINWVDDAFHIEVLWLSGYEYWVQTPVFTISKVWVWVPVVSLVALTKTLTCNHCMLRPSDGTA